jgi:hypothetical protein
MQRNDIRLLTDFGAACGADAQEVPRIAGEKAEIIPLPFGSDLPSSHKERHKGKQPKQ